MTINSIHYFMKKGQRCVIGIRTRAAGEEGLKMHTNLLSYSPELFTHNFKNIAAPEL